MCASPGTAGLWRSSQASSPRELTDHRRAELFIDRFTHSLLRARPGLSRSARAKRALSAGRPWRPRAHAALHLHSARVSRIVAVGVNGIRCRWDQRRVVVTRTGLSAYDILCIGTQHPRSLWLTHSGGRFRVRRCALLACWFAAISDSRSLRKFSTACTVRAMVESFGRLSSLRTSSCILRTEHGPAKGEATAGDLAARARSRTADRYRTRRHRPDQREWRRSTGRDGARSDVTHRVQRRRLQRRFLLFETLGLLELLREVLGKRRIFRIRAHFLRLLQGRPHRPWDEADATCHSLPLPTAERVQCCPSAQRLCQSRTTSAKRGTRFLVHRLS